jgi:cytochrome c oxidase subunit III
VILREAPWRTAAASGGPAWLRLTLGLGLLFIGGQVLAWRDLAAQGLFLATNPSSAFFYVFTALHALHLLGGIAALGYVLIRLHRSATWPSAGALDATSLYWHFMDVLWLYLLVVLAVWF